MPRGVVCTGIMWVACAGWAMAQAPAPRNAPPAPSAAESAHRAMIDRYCVGCHDARTKTAGLTLERGTVDLARVPDAGETWEKVVRRLRTRTVPPPGLPRPDEASYDGLASWLEARLDRAGAARPNPGPQRLRRLNRTEYGNAIRDLLALDLDVASLLPPDGAAHGFDNVTDRPDVSPALMERYLVAADRISALAVGAPAEPVSVPYLIRQDRSQDQHIEGLPLGTVGGLVVTHTFPLDGEYRFSLELYKTNQEAIRGLEHPHQVEITVDGERIFLGTVGGEPDRQGSGNITDRMRAIDARLQVRVPVRAGQRAVGATFVRKIGAGTQRLRPFLRSSAGTYDSTGRPHIETLTVAGPFEPRGPGDTPSRRRVFSCHPSRAADQDSPASAKASAGSRRSAQEIEASDEKCARQILAVLARRAFRRPLTDDDLATLLAFYRSGREKGGFDAGIQMALRRVLASPSFLFRIEQDPTGRRRDGLSRVSDLDLASRLSFFLWSSIPDDELLDTAARGQLSNRRVLDRQVRRMLADPRAFALAEHFAGQWLLTRTMRTIVPNHHEFPDFDDTLREAFGREVELFFDSVVREDRSVLDLLTAADTFVNERLAKHYGIPHVYGSHFRRVTVPDARRGLLGKGSLLLATSDADRTVPSRRGEWILENVLGVWAPPPLSGAPGLRPFHEKMGRALEHFDAVGFWRTHEAGSPIDSSGELPDGTTVDGVVALREALLARPDLFVGTLAEKLLTYALGRGMQHDDMPVVRQIVRDAAREDHRFSALVMGIVTSVPFQMRMTTGE